jgi:replication initiation and membrane attachment protein DnaB
MQYTYIRKGHVRNGFSLMYHEIFDLYHPYIGDKATLYYLFLVRYRNNDEKSQSFGKSWRGRSGIVEKFQLSYSTLPVLDDILQAAGLINIETIPSGRGKNKIYYIVHDPLPEEKFKRNEAVLVKNLKKLIAEKANTGKDIIPLLGKEKGRLLLE